ncbi:MAG: accessory Sec system protein Asp3 [Streptococcaceae bacterium]|jgi:accessory secretory protein Asp3|nr:accessory Sec system protein Asp3 [Streptococcaceae bacterium]
MKNLYLIKWGSDFTDNENEGAEISVAENGEVTFEAPLASSGLVLKSWTAKRNYLDARKSPELPLLEGGKTYQIGFMGEVMPKESIQLAVAFWDDADSFLETVYLKNLIGEFTYPEGAARYEIQLINKHHEKIQFTYLWLAEKALLEGVRWELSKDTRLFRVWYENAGISSWRWCYRLMGTQSFEIPEEGERLYILGGASDKGEEIMDALEGHARRLQPETFVKGVNYTRMPQSYQQLYAALSKEEN